MTELQHGLAADSLEQAGEEDAARGNATAPVAPLAWFEGRSRSYDTATPYGPFIDLFTTVFGLGAEETDEEKYHKNQSQDRGK